MAAASAPVTPRAGSADPTEEFEDSPVDLPRTGIGGADELRAVASYQDTDAVRAAGSLAVPTLLVVAEDDGGPADDAVEIEEACACENLELLTVPSSRHGVELLRSTDAGAGEINRQVLEFLAGIG